MLIFGRYTYHIPNIEDLKKNFGELEAKFKNLFNPRFED